MGQRGYVSSTLVHWTGRGKHDEQALEILRTICEERLLRLTYCPNYVQPDISKQTEMVCFTDIPLLHSREHCKKFGRLGIGFKKTSLMRYGANPVLYTTGVHMDRIKKVISLLERMIDREKDREWRSELEPYPFEEDETDALAGIGEFLQEYSYKNRDDTSDYVTYYQREWRLPFSILEFAGGGAPQAPGMGGFYIRDGTRYKTMAFAPADVDFIVVPIRYWWKGRALSRLIGCKLRILELAVWN